MNEKIQQIIAELIALDPAFAKYKQELETVLADILAIKPEPQIDEEFVMSLRRQLMNKEVRPGFAGSVAAIKNTFMKKLVFSAVTVAVVVIAAAAALVYIKKPINPNLTFNTKAQITRTSDHAFGSLNTLASATGKGGGGGGAAAPSESAPMAMGIGGGGGDSMPYFPTNYKYVYKGDTLKLDKSTLDVLKKINPDLTQTAAGMQSFGLGLVNLNSFSGSKVQSISFNQDQGYNVYVDLVNGNVSISGYYEATPYDAKLCTVNGCPQPPPIDPKDVPDDATLISLANEFVSAHGISTANYEQPEVMEDQGRIMNKSYPISEVQQVIYPMKVSDNEIYDEAGNKSGLQVGINIRTKKVTSLWNLTTANYQASSYDAETDASRIQKIAEQGGMYSYSGDPNAKKTVEIDLGTPTMQYVQMWDYKDNLSTQILVPSMVFPVTKQPTDGSFYRKAVIVPLIKDILDKQNTSGSPVNIMTETAPASAAK